MAHNGLSQLSRVLFAAVAALHVGFGARRASLLRDEISLILDLLSRRACPAGVMHLLQVGLAGLPIVAGTALALALSPAGYGASLSLTAGLAVDALAGCRFHCGGRFAALQPPTAVHVLTLAACAPAAWDRHMTTCSTTRITSGPPKQLGKQLGGYRRVLAATATGVLGAATSFVPASTARAVLHCTGQTLLLPACGVATAGATLVPLGVGTHVLTKEKEANEPAEQDVPTVSRRVLSMSLGLGGLAQAAVVLCGAHADAFCWWARGALVSACGSCGAASLHALYALPKKQCVG